MSYHCEEVKPISIHHERGDIILEPVDGKTKMTWISEARLGIPIIGSLLGKWIEPRVSRLFQGILEHIDASPRRR